MIRSAALLLALAASGFALAQQTVSTAAGPWPTKPVRIMVCASPGGGMARSRGFPADGPYPADAIFVRATRKTGGYDGVVTMYHDQGRIAMKLLGFERGVTVQGGLPMPITTPAHGTVYDIAGPGRGERGRDEERLRPRLPDG